MVHLTEERQMVVNSAVQWYRNSSEQVFQFSGGPGTGKSVVLNSIIRALGLNINQVAPMAYVGAAAIVMRTKGLINARTIHSWLYTPVMCPVLDENGEPIIDTYFDRPKMTLRFVTKDLSEINLIAIDEAGTVPLHMKHDIESRGKKILVCGDLDQLEPVMDKPAYLYTGKVYRLTQIMRQAENSAIVYLCQRAKAGLPIHTGLYGDEVLVIGDDEVTNSMIANSNVILCGKNATRSHWNDYIRSNILGYNSIIPNMGEKLICRKNNWGMDSGGINLTNGLTGRVMNAPDPSKFDGKTFTIDFMPDLTNSPFLNIPVDYTYFTAPYENKQAIKMDKWSVGDKFEYGYAQTVHLAQGSQWTQGIYFEEYLHPDTNNRLNYTALSRFSNRCIYVKQRKKFY